MTHPGYRNTALAGSLGTDLLHSVCNKARSSGFSKLFALTTQTRDWFLENGFVDAKLSDLPQEKQAMYNFQRNAKVMSLELGND